MWPPDPNYCPNCGQHPFSRQRGELLLRCHRCGWVEGLPVVRWVSRVPFRLVSGVVSLRLVVVAVAIVLLAPFAAGFIGGVSGGLGDAEDVDVQRAERLILDEVNERRESGGMASLDWNEKAAQAAKEHAADMAERDYFSHTSPDGETQTERYAFCDGGENAAKTQVDERLSEQWSDEVYEINNASHLAYRVTEGWMHSRLHRERGIYGDRWTSAGAGIAMDDNGSAYVVLGFCSKTP